MQSIEAGMVLAAAAALWTATQVTAAPWTATRDHEPTHYVNAGGPPPWAPAHGYRAKHGKHYDRPDADIIVLPATGIGRCNRDLLGGLIGAAAGGLGGSQIGKGSGNTAAIIAGVIVGGVLGGEIGRAMDRTDVACTGQVLERLPTGRAATWVNPDTGARYDVEPTHTYQSDGGRYCREYTARAAIDNQIHATKGVACRRPDGTWDIVG